MSSNRILAILILTIFLASCAKAETGTADLVHVSSRAPSNYRTIECEPGEVSRTYSSQASIDYDTEVIIFNSEDRGILKEIYAFNRQTVSKGDILADIEYDNIALNDELEKLRLNILNSETFLEIDKRIKQDAIAQMYEPLSSMAAHEAEVLKLKIEKAKLEHELYVYETELKIAKLKREMAEIEEKLKGVTLTAPVDGVVGGISTIRPGGWVDPGTVLMYVYYNDNIRLRIHADSSNFRYNMAVEIEIANGGTYSGRIVSNPLTANPDGGSLDFAIHFDDLPEVTVSRANALLNRRISVSGKSVEITGIPVLPYNAIYNENGNRYVMLFEDNIVKKRYVQLGLFNFQTAEILSGVKPGDKILE